MNTLTESAAQTQIATLRVHLWGECGREIVAAIYQNEDGHLSLRDPDSGPYDDPAYQAATVRDLFDQIEADGHYIPSHAWHRPIGG